jgi:hypothetical protein
VLDHAYLLSFASCHYKDPHFKPADTGFDEEAMWLFGPCGHDAYRSLAVRTEPLASRPFPDAGWYILRHDRDYCFVVCGPNGLNGLGGHTHNDKLSFELMLDGEDVVVDPGTYVYTSDPMWRRAFRKTSSHNTVSIGGLEQNDISRDLFYVKSGVETKLIRFDESSEAIRFSGEVRYLGTEVIHRREVLLWKNGGGLEVRDTVKGADNATAALCLGAAAEKCVFDGPHVTQEKGWYSKEYGIKEQTARLVMAVGSEPLRIHRVLTNAGKNQSAS